MPHQTNHLFEWRRQLASTDGPESPITRHVLLTLSLHMDVSGGSCHPSTRTLKKETGLTRKTVEKHLQIGEEEGWTWTDPEWRSGQRKDYQATLPDHLQEEESGVTGSPLSPGESTKSGVARTPVKDESGVRGTPVQGDEAEYELPRSGAKAGEEVPRSEEAGEEKAEYLTTESGVSDAKSGVARTPEDVRGRKEDVGTTTATTDPPNPPTEQRGVDEEEIWTTARVRRLLIEHCLLGEKEATSSNGKPFTIDLLMKQWSWCVEKRGVDPGELAAVVSIAREVSVARGIIEPEEPFSLHLIVRGLDTRDHVTPPEDWEYYQELLHEAQKRQQVSELAIETAGRMKDIDELIEEAG